MRYISTRGQAPPVSFLDAVLAGLAPDGGLYVPEQWPKLDFGDGIANGSYVGAATRVLEAFAGDGLGESAVDLCNEAYIAAPGDPNDESWPPKWPDAVTPLRQTGPAAWRLELFHGPSLSFKDVAMQLIGPLYDHALTRRDARLSVVCATSGDTGGAAVQALAHRDRIDLFVLTPKERVSEVQRRFMTTSGASNIYAIEIGGDFDVCQAIIKALFSDAAFAAGARLSSVNSINWARIVAQSVYFQIVAHTLGANGPVSFVVPTGNFGDAYSGWIAKQLGAPIGRIVLATNDNDILARALTTGCYQRGASKATLSPAMDIQVASNFERILFEALDRDATAVQALYASFSQSGGFEIPAQALARLREDFSAVAVNDDAILTTMREAWGHGQELLCPHSAVGEFGRTMGADPPVVVLATAHPAKFPETVERATGVRPALPAKCADLFEREEELDSLPADAEVVKQYIRERSRAWS